MGSTQIDIRPAYKSDAPAILGIFNRRPDIVALGPTVELGMSKVKLVERLNQPQVRKLRLVYDPIGRVLGLVEYQRKDYQGERGHAFLSLLMLAPDPPNNDLAKEIVSQVETEIGKDSRVRSLFSAVETNNIPALRFWIKMGYSIVDGPFWRSDKVAVFILKKNLPRQSGVNLFKNLKETQIKKVDFYRDILRSLVIWDSYLMAESGLPGPRANLELAQAVADEGSEDLFWRYAVLNHQEAPINTPAEFLSICGVIGLGVLLARGDPEAALALRVSAGDPRWRVREAVCIALQGYGAANFQGLLALTREWARGSWLEKRAAAAALCESRLLQNPARLVEVLNILDEITASMLADFPHDETTKVLQQGLSYCWSVAVAAHPVEGKKRLEKWFTSDEKTILKIMRENLKKHRLKKMDQEWVKNWTRQVDKSLIRLKKPAA